MEIICVNSMASKTRTGEREVGSQDPTSVDELGSRISLVVGLYKTKTQAARSAGTTLEMLNRYIRGEHKLPLEKATGLCEPVGVSMNWLAWGIGPMLLSDCTPAAPSALDRMDEALLANLVEGVDVFLAAEDLQLPPRHKARVTVLFYRLLERRRARLQTEGSDIPPELRIGGHPVDISADPDLSDIVRLAE